MQALQSHSSNALLKRACARTATLPVVAARTNRRLSTVARAAADAAGVNPFAAAAPGLAPSPASTPAPAAPSNDQGDGWTTHTCETIMQGLM